MCDFSIMDVSVHDDNGLRSQYELLPSFGYTLTDSGVNSVNTPGFEARTAANLKTR